MKSTPGLCGCGCGQRTEIADRNDAARGWVKGQPKFYLPYHQARVPRDPRMFWNYRGGRTIDARGYPRLMAKGHPGADGRGYVKEHTLIVERAMQKPLRNTAPVHHVNGVKDDNRNTNLVACHDQAYHMLLHVRQDSLDACGNADWRRCHDCGVHDDPRNMVRAGRNRHVHSRCRKAQRQRQGATA